MNATKNVPGRCQLCGGRFEFPAESTGATGTCPLCGETTEFVLAVPEIESGIPRKAILFVLLAVVILVGGLIAAQFAVKRAQRLYGVTEAASPGQSSPSAGPRATGPFSAMGYEITPVILEKTEGSSLVYAVGSITNVTDRRRFGVRVELDLFDRNGQKLATARDYTATLEPRAVWRFRAMVLDPQTASASISSIREGE